MPSKTAAAKKAPRPYDSSLRAQRAKETRATVMAAAAELFTTQGWKGTGMRDVANKAGVAIETVYKHFSSKTVLLQAVIDVAVVGDEEQVAVADRENFAAIGQGARRQRLAAAARLAREVAERTAGFAMVLREAAPGDEQIAEMLQATRDRQRQDAAAGIELITGQAPTKEQVDEVWAMVSPELYLLFVNEAGWTPAAYETWLAATLDRVVPRPSKTKGSTDGD